MKHAARTDELAERAALYALGALTLTESRAFEDHLMDGCEVCQAESEQFQFTVESLATVTPDVEPPTMVLDRLRDDIRGNQAIGGLAGSAAPDKADESHSFVFLRAGDDQWEETMNGVFVRPLFVDPVSGMMTSLLRMAPGTSLPPHEHTGVEQFLIIEGDCQVCGELLGPGDYHRAMAGSVHESTYTENGTTLLLVAPKEYRFVEASHQ